MQIKSSRDCPHQILFCISALGPHISHFTFPSCFKGVWQDHVTYFALVRPRWGLQVLQGWTPLQDQDHSCEAYSSPPAALPKLTISYCKLKFRSFLILMRTTFPVETGVCQPPVDPGPDVTRLLPLLSSETFSSQTNRVCHSRQIFIHWTSFPYASSWWMYKNTVTAMLKT